MKKTMNISELKQKIDYESLRREIVAESENRRLTRQNPFADLLDPVKDALLTARQNQVSFQTLAKHLTNRGIAISASSL